MAMSEVLTCPFQLSIDQFASEAGIDHAHPIKQLFLYKMKENERILIDKEVLSWFEFKGVLSKQKVAFKCLLVSNDIEFQETENILTVLPKNLEAAALLLDTDKDREIQDVITLLKRLLVNYGKYKTQYENSHLNGNKKLWISRIYKRKLRPRKQTLRLTSKATRRKNDLLDLEIISENMAPLPANVFKRETFVIYQIGTHKYYVIRCQFGNYKKAIENLIVKFPNAVKILKLCPEANARSLYIRLREYCNDMDVYFNYNNVDLGQGMSIDDFLQVLSDVREEKLAILKLATKAVND